jgi:hypothetical protein
MKAVRIFQALCLASAALAALPHQFLIDRVVQNAFSTLDVYMRRELDRAHALAGPHEPRVDQVLEAGLASNREQARRYIAEKDMMPLLETEEFVAAGKRLDTQRTRETIFMDEQERVYNELSQGEQRSVMQAADTAGYYDRIIRGWMAKNPRLTHDAAAQHLGPDQQQAYAHAREVLRWLDSKVASYRRASTWRTTP